MIQLPLRLPDPQKPTLVPHFGRQLHAGGADLGTHLTPKTLCPIGDLREPSARQLIYASMRTQIISRPYVAVELEF